MLLYNSKQTAIRMLLFFFVMATVGMWLHLIVQLIPIAIAIIKLQLQFWNENYATALASLFTLGCAIALFAKVE